MSGSICAPSQPSASDVRVAKRCEAMFLGEDGPDFRCVNVDAVRSTIPDHHCNAAAAGQMLMQVGEYTQSVAEIGRQQLVVFLATASALAFDGKTLDEWVYEGVRAGS